MAEKRSKAQTQAKAANPETAAAVAAAAKARAAAVDTAAKEAKAAEAARAKAEAEKAKMQQHNIAWLSKTAKSINATIGRMEIAVGKVNDFRATLAVKLSEAEEVCRASKLSFKEWAEANITKKDGSGPYSYSELRRLTKIGKDANGSEEEARKLIENMRKDTARRVAEHAQRKKDEAAQEEPKSDDSAESKASSEEAVPSEEAAPGAGHNQGPPMDTAANAGPEGLLAAFNGLSGQAKLQFLEAIGEAMGLTIIVTKSNRQVWPPAN